MFYLLNTNVVQCNQFRSLQLFLNHLFWHKGPVLGPRCIRPKKDSNPYIIHSERLLCPMKCICHQVSGNTLWYYLNFLFLWAQLMFVCAFNIVRNLHKTLRLISFLDHNTE